LLAGWEPVGGHHPRLRPDPGDGLGDGRWGRDIQANGEQLTLTVHNEASIPEINRYLVAQGANVFAISPSRLSLEDIFIETVGKDGGL
jgi:hypothetical protein